MTKTRYHETAGGVVIDEQGRVLVIVRDVERNGSVVHEVRLPKGHIDPGETPEQAALREVGEESGYWGLEIVADLGTARSEFDFRSKHHVRDERYYLMRLVSTEYRGQEMAPGSEESLFRPEWLTLNEAGPAMTFSSEREFICRAKSQIDFGSTPEDRQF